MPPFDPASATDRTTMEISSSPRSVLHISDRRRSNNRRALSITKSSINRRASFVVVAEDNTGNNCCSKHYPYTITVPFSSRSQRRERQQQQRMSSSRSLDNSMSSLGSSSSSSDNNSSFSSTNYGSSSSFGSAASTRTTQKLKVTFNDEVNVLKFLPDWADPRVQEHDEAETKQQQLMQSPQTNNGEGKAYTTAELRRLDNCYVKVLRKHWATTTSQQQRNGSSTTSFFSEDVWCPRGLEAHFDIDHTYLRRKIRLQASLVVLLMQARQEAPEEIARHYQTLSRKSHGEAHRQALLDELDANHALGDAVLNTLKSYRKDKSTHSNKLRQTMQELEYTVSSTSSSSSRN